MKRVSVREIRLHWPQVEKRLRQTDRLVVTRDNEPVATLTAFVGDEKASAARFDFAANRRWVRHFWKGKTARRRSDDMLAEERGEG